MCFKNAIKLKQGFTLIELLVVIAIIALLLSIILPSLTKVKEMARRTVCAAHMKDIGQQVAVYAHNNDDWLLPRKIKDDNGKLRNDLPYNLWSRSFYVRWDSGLDSNGYWNLGGLWESGQMDGSGEIFYCPSKFSRFQYKDHTIPAFPTPKPVTGGEVVDTSYSFNPECESISNRMRKYKKMVDGGSHMLLLVDLLDVRGITHEKGWNVMQGDGSVSFKIVPEVQQIIEELSAADPEDLSFNQQDYTRFDKVLRLLK